jgi:hypothetical protein
MHMHCLLRCCCCCLQPEGIHTANTAAASGAAFQLLVEVMWNALELLRQHTVAHEQVRRAHALS